MSYVNPTANVISRTVQESWHNANAADYVWNQLGIGVQTLGLRTNHSGVTTYQLPKLDNALLKTDGRGWRPGDDLGPVRGFNEESVTITLLNEANLTTGFPIPRDGQRNRLMDAQRQVPQHLSQLYARRESALYTLLTGGTFGNFSFTGTEPLIARNTTGDQAPIRDIDGKIRGFRFWRQAGSYRLIMICDERFLDAIAAHPAYTGGGQGDLAGGSGSGTAGKLEPNAITERLRRLHRLDAVYVMSSVADTVDLGQTSAPGFIATGGFCWLGLVQTGRFDLKSDTSMGPDGAFNMGYEYDPWVDDWQEVGREMHYYKGKDAFRFYSIRGSVMGACFTGNITS